MAAAALASSSLCSYVSSSIRETRISASSTPPTTDSRRFGTSLLPGSHLLIKRAMNNGAIRYSPKTRSVSIRCEQSTKEGSSGLDVWLGRLAMVGFAAALSVEIATGKGLLQNFGLTEPAPTAALAVTALVGVVTAVFIFQSSSSTNN